MKLDHPFYLVLTLHLALHTTAAAEPEVQSSTSTSTSTLLGKKKSGASGCDVRKQVRDTTVQPHSAVARVRYVDPTGKLGNGISGSLVGPHMMLTCGHCVFNKSAKAMNQRPMVIMPGAYMKNSRETALPFGEYRLTKPNAHKQVNSAFASGRYHGGNEYGAMYLVCPFKHLQTFIPVAFQAPMQTVTSMGYPAEDLPRGIRKGNQLTGSAGVGRGSAPNSITYGVRSTGAASGAPVFVHEPDSGTYRQVGVNAGHKDECTGGGARLSEVNRALIESWLKWKPSRRDLLAKDCGRIPNPTTWRQLKALYRAKKAPLISVDQLKIKAKPKRPESTPEWEVYQYIRGTLYHWKEYRARTKRYLRMLSPTKKWLSVKEAQYLLSASAQWHDSKTAKAYRSKAKHKTRIMGPYKGSHMPVVK